ncbi:MAG: molecular chaperone HtpG [Gammaproteobacteria bacterium]|nr:molecular chaperone HtpG [Gammaproteobacteria bacterium]MCW8909157.1 molecular chaperone HtpG [Gammaproteobacteria bacterium]MCW9056352.1 molecular chaperone HtpG [Gammaproteobacteria bacterium]
MSVEAYKETLEFQAEVKQLLKLMIHSLYSNKEIFLRELISNASDACDKLRFEALGKDDLYESDPELKIRIDYDKDNKTITFTDNGIGMSRDELVENIGTIASSGTKRFMESLSGDQAKDSQLIGQFGVGFYSTFIIADKVTVMTRRAGLSADQGVRWESDGEGSFSLETIEREQRGTEIILHVREGEEEFIDGWRLRNIIHTYSDHISLPIIMKKEVTGEDDKKDQPPEDETVNKASALWVRPKKDIEEEEYKEFYKHIAHDFEEPVKWTHNRVEGNQSYTSLLFVPKHAPFDLYERDRKRGIKLYVKRVFIMDETEHLMPNYLRFIRGIVDSDDLPLNVSREILQHNRVIDKIRAASVKKVLGMLESMAKNEAEQYADFWGAFGQVMKEGPIEDFANKEQLAKLLRFSSTHTDDATQNVSLEDYVSRMKEGQQTIYFITAESFAAAKNSPHLEVFRRKGIEVLLMSDRVDEWLVEHLTEYDGKKLQSVAKGDLDLGDIEDEADKKAQKKAEGDFKDVIEKVKGCLQDKAKDVRITHRLTDSPSCLVLEQHDMGLQMQQILKAAGQNAPASKPILELNPEHELIVQLKDMDGDQLDDWSNILFDQAMLAEGGQLEDPAAFVKRMNSMLKSS